MKSLTEHNTSYSFYEKVADDMLKKMDVFDLPLQIILWFQFGIVGLFFDIT